MWREINRGRGSLNMKHGEANETVSTGSAETNIMHHFGGYHRCCLGDPMHLEFVGEKFCTMLGYQETELAKLTGEVYTALVHPDDTALFDDFAQRLAENEGCESIAYRLIKKDGSIIRVVDTMASVLGDDGCMRGYSVVSEVIEEQLTATPTAPGEKIAVLKVSGDFGATIDRMCGVASMLLAVDSASTGLQLLDFVAMAERDNIRKAIEKAHTEEYSGMEVCTLISTSGKTYRCDLWVECIHIEESLEDSFFCVKIETEFDHQHESEEMLSFGKQLFSTFTEDLFEADRVEDSVKYIAHSEKGLIELPLNVRMFTDDITVYLLDRVSPEHREAVKDFCLRARSGELSHGFHDSAKLKFDFLDKDGSVVPAVLTMASISKAKFFMGISFDTDPTAGDCFASVMTKKQVNVTLFGAFSLIADGNAINIRSEKAKELLALLVERRGAFVSAREAIATLWECEPDETTRARYRKVASRLMSELNRNEIGHIVESDRGARRIVPENIECDYYDYRDGLRDISGQLLPEYSWAEYVRLD